MVLDIYLISVGGLNLYTYRLEEDVQNEEIFDHLFSNVIYGVVKSIQCLIDQNLNVKSIDLGLFKLHFKYGMHVWGFLLTNKKIQDVNDKLESLIFKFEEKFGNILENWDGNRNKFQDTDEIIAAVFN